MWCPSSMYYTMLCVEVSLAKMITQTVIWTEVTHDQGPFLNKLLRLARAIIISYQFQENALISG